jgi:signal transduction histidine kinase
METLEPWVQHAEAIQRQLLDYSPELNLLVQGEAPYAILAARGPCEPILGCALDALKGMSVQLLEPGAAAGRAVPFEVSLLEYPGVYAEVAIQRRDGTLGMVTIRVHPIVQGQDESPPSVVLLRMQDVQQQLELGAELRELYTRLQRAHVQMREQEHALAEARRAASLSLFAAGLAHELNNPVAVLASTAQSLPSYLEDLYAPLSKSETVPDEFAEIILMMEEIRAACTRISNAVKPLGELEVTDKSETFELMAVLRGMMPAFGSVNIQGPAKVLVTSDEDTLRRLLRPVLDNARKAAGPHETLQLVVREVGENIELEVTDRGPGVPVELRDRVFDPFFTTRPPGGGLGLGLFLAQRAAGALHGDVRLEAGPEGIGTRVTARIARSRTPSSEAYVSYEALRSK